MKKNEWQLIKEFRERKKQEAEAQKLDSHTLN